MSNKNKKSDKELEAGIYTFLVDKEKEKNNLIKIFNNHLPTEEHISTKDAMYSAFDNTDKKTKYYILKELSKSTKENDGSKGVVSEHDVYYFSRRFRMRSKFTDKQKITIEENMINELKEQTQLEVKNKTQGQSNKYKIK